MNTWLALGTILIVLIIGGLLAWAHFGPHKSD